MEILSIFDQTNKDVHNRQVLNIDEAIYEGDSEMLHILHRLLAAASDSKLRQDMNVEDEYFSAIETRDTAIMNRDKEIAEQDIHIAEQSAHIAEQDIHIAEQNVKLEEQRSTILFSAKAMKSAGLPLEQISAITKLSIDEIQALD